MHARSALFDLYGDHVRSRGGRASVAALIRLLGALDITPPAVRTAVSRMVRQGWLDPVRLDTGPGYALTVRARHRLDEAAARIYRTRQNNWDGCWDVLVLQPILRRSARERVRSGLTFLGYAPLSETTWISAHASDEAAGVLSADSVGWHRFRSLLAGDPARLAATAWDLAALGATYDQWHDDIDRVVAAAGPDPDDECAFAVRSRLVHEWRKFLFSDPGLPRELLPTQWPGDSAAAYFDRESARLLPGAGRFVDNCLKTQDEQSRPSSPGSVA